MPKIVDHTGRRAEIGRVVRELVADGGLDAVTLREVTARMGLSNGALKPYFPSKAALVETAFELVLSDTRDRIAWECRSLTGREALHRFALEMLPLDARRITEARVVVPFWAKAMTEPALRATNAEANRFFTDFTTRACREAGVPEDRIPALTSGLLVYLLGAQSAVVTDPAAASASALLAGLEVWLEALPEPAPEAAAESDPTARSGVGGGG